MNILISGYYGFHNAGDEALLSGMLTALEKAGPVEATVLSHDPQATERLHGVQALRRTDAGALWKKLKETDLFVSGGGGLIQDRTSRRSALYYLSLLCMAQRAGVPTYVYAQGVGPVRAATVRAVARHALKGIVGAGARDAESASLLVRLGADKQKVHVSADAAFALAPPPGLERWQLLRSHGIPMEHRPLIGVAWRNPVVSRRRLSRGGRKDPRIALRRVAEDLAAFAGRIDARIVIVPLYPGIDDEGSESLATAIDGAGWSAVGTARDCPDFRSVRALLGKMDINVSVRYHGVVFSALSHVPAVALEYDPKVQHLARQLGLPGLPFFDDALPRGERPVYEALRALWRDRNAVRDTLGRRVAELRALALAEGVRAHALGRRSRGAPAG